MMPANNGDDGQRARWFYTAHVGLPVDALTTFSMPVKSPIACAISSRGTGSGVIVIEC